MPVLDLLKRDALIKAGYNPDEMDEIQEVSPVESVDNKEQQNPSSVASSTLDTPKKTSSFGAGFREAIRSIPGAATGLGVGSAVAEATLPAAAIPIIGPLIPPLAGLIAGGGAAALERYGQNKLISKVAPSAPIVGTEQEALDTQEHPIATKVGGIAAQFPFMGLQTKAGIQGAGRALRDIVTKPITQVPINPADLNELANIGIGAAAPVGQTYAEEAYNQNTLTPKLDTKDLLISALGGGALSRVRDTKLNSLLRLHPSAEREFPLAGLKEKQVSGEPVEDVGPKALIPERVTPIEMGDGKSEEDIKPKNLSEVDALLKHPLVDEYAKAQKSLSDQEQATKKDIEIKKQQAEELRLTREAENAGKVKEDNAFSQEELERQLKANQTPTEDNFNPKTNPQKTNTKNIEKANSELAAPLSEGERIQEEYDKGIREQETPQVSSDLAESGISTIPTKQYAEAFKRLGVMRNVKVDDSGRVFSPESGKEIAGIAYLRDGIKEALNKINPNKSGLDTYPHELFHVFLDDLEKYGSSADKNLIKDARTKFLGEEPLTASVGLDSVRRGLNSDKKSDFNNWLSDFWSHVKRRFGKASDEDYARILSSRLINDPSFNDSIGKVSFAGGGNNEEKSKTQEESRISREASSGAIGRSAGITPVPPTEKDRFSLAGAKPLIEQVRSIKDSSHAGTLADAMTKFFEEQRFNRGDFVNRFNLPAKDVAGLHLSDAIKGVASGDLGKSSDYLFQNSKEANNVLQHFYDKADGKTPAPLSPNEQKLKSIVDDVNAHVSKEVGKRGLDNTKLGTDFFPQVPDNNILKTIQENPESPKSKKLIKDFIDYHTAHAPVGEPNPRAYAEKEFSKLKNAWSNKNIDIGSTYGPIDKDSLVKLPPSWREKNLMSVMNRHLERISKRLAHHTAFDSDPKALEALNALKTNKNVQAVLDSVSGIGSSDENKLNAALGIIKASAMGPLTGAKDIYTGLFQGAQHQQNPIQTAKSIVHAVSHLSENLADSFKTGFNRSNLNAIEWTNDTADIISGLRRVRDVISEVQGRNWMEQQSRALSFGIGRFTTLDFANQLSKGKLSSAGKEFFDNFGKGIDLKGGKLTKEDINQISARFGESVQGTYDYRGLPKFAFHGQLSPILALARWNIEKSNNYAKYVVNPLLKGNIRPFLMSTLSPILGGVGVTALVSTITGRKQNTPELGELKEAAKEGYDTKLPWLYKAIGLASASGYAGILGDVAKSTLDVMYAKTRPQVYNNMLIQAGDNIATTGGNLIRSISEDGFNPHVVMDAVGQILEQNIQGYRLLLAHLSADKQEDIEKVNKLRDLRVYHTLKGDDLSDLSGSYSKPFKHEPAKEFKDTQDLGRAQELLPDLLNKAFEKAKGDPDKLESELSKLKENSYQTMPSIDKDTGDFSKYFNFLAETQGREEAVKRLSDYLQKNQNNEIKSALVP